MLIILYADIDISPAFSTKLMLTAPAAAEATLAAFLASEEARFISGHGMYVDGGAMQQNLKTCASRRT